MNRIIFAGDGHGAIAALKSLQMIFSIVEIYSNDDDVLALKRSNDGIIFDFSEGKSEYVVLAGYKKIISYSVLKTKVFINTHPSLLPEYRGYHSVVWAMLNFEREIGFTVHLANEYMDDGDILYQYKITYKGQTSKEIMDDFDHFVERKLGSIVLQYINGKIKPIIQDKKNATWCGKRNLDDCIINFEWENKRLEMFFKALVQPYPLPRIHVKEKVYEVLTWKLKKTKEYFTDIGRVLNIDNEGIWIKTKEGFLILDTLWSIQEKKNVDARSVLKLGMRLM